MSSTGLTVLVTGANGYIASHVIQQLLSAGHVVRGSVRNVKDEAKVQHLYDLCPKARENLHLVEADLLDAESWIPAVEGVYFVLHMASPNPTTLPEPGQENTVIRPAVEGTQNVLKACVRTPSVRRVIMTSSALAIDWGKSNTSKVYTEENWSNEADLDASALSKLLAEKAAWEFMKSLLEECKLELVVINPSVVMGPTLHHRESNGSLMVQRLLDHLIPAVPKMDIPVADVRDVARAHIVAMTSPEAVGHRHIICSGNMWMSEMANLLKSIFESQGYKVPTMVAPNFILKMASKMDASVKPILPYLGVVHKYDNSQMREVLGIEPHNMRDTLVDMAHAMIKTGLANKTSGYVGPRGEEERASYLAMKL